MYKFQVNYWDEDDRKAKDEQGLVSAKNYGAAAERVVQYYGAANVSSVYLEEWEDVLIEDEVLEGFQSWIEPVKA